VILSVQSIRHTAPIENMVEQSTHLGVSRGLSSASYDLRLAEDVLLWPGRFVLASTLEKFRMPLDLAGVVHDKSTWARRGVCVQNTLIDPGFRGWLTLEITNHSWRFWRLRQGMGIAQVVFHMLDEPTQRPYNSKYQDQERGAQAPRYSEVD
jgi:dCTP deaminase